MWESGNVGEIGEKGAVGWEVGEPILRFLILSDFGGLYYYTLYGCVNGCVDILERWERYHCDRQEILDVMHFSNFRYCFSSSVKNGFQFFFFLQFS